VFAAKSTAKDNIFMYLHHNLCKLLFSRLIFKNIGSGTLFESDQASNVVVGLKIK
jgi:hypothetical protein